MFEKSIERLNSGIYSLQEFVTINNEVRNLLGTVQEGLELSHIERTLLDMKNLGPSPAQWRVMDHCAAVGRLYALYEQFSESILSDWIEFRSSGRNFMQLPESFRAAYQDGFIQVSNNITKSRYEHLSFNELIKQYNRALSGDLNYKLAPECLIHHRNNLRWPDLCTLCAQSGIDTLPQWISQNSALAQFFQTDRKLQELTASKLKAFIDYRNEAAHGSVAIDEILGPQQILEIAKFIQILCQGIYDLLNFEVIQILIKDGKAAQIGIITESFSQNIVVALLEGVKIKIGDNVSVLTDRSYHSRLVVTLNIDNQSFEEIQIANAREVGIKFSGPTPKRSKIFVIDQL